MFLEKYGNFDVTNTVLSFYDVTQQFLITISDKHRNCPVVNIFASLPLTLLSAVSFLNI